jgi:uncharacterized FAD-dependent dehydrogenase
MIRVSELKLPITHSEPSEQDLIPHICKALSIPATQLLSHCTYKRSYDARRSVMALTYIVDCTVADEAAVLHAQRNNPHVKVSPDINYYPVGHAPATVLAKQRPIVVGFGPCGIFAALILAQMGFKPIVLERGKAVRERTKDTWALWRKGELNPDSNAQFGEGGAGTFSDGKLYSQIKDPRHLGRKVINEFIKAGAPAEIAVAAHPHIGTFRLVGVVETMRQTIIELGGEVRFEQKVTDILIENGVEGKAVQGVQLADGSVIESNHVIIALGHSARETFEVLHQRGVHMEAKPFSVGFRIEHPQGMIDAARWGRHAGNPLLGAADYKLVHHAKNDRAVYSFCMCPGGTVVAATSEVGRVVTNGMSQYSRNERNANAGIVVNIDPIDFPEDAKANPLAGVILQRQLESHAYVLGGSNYHAPAQLVGDFIVGKTSTHLGKVEPSYKPGVTMTSLYSALPDYAITAMREALPAFGKKIKGFDRYDAVLTGVETRTSSPMRVTRGDDCQSVNVKGLYPAGEGAGYAGGILSAGVDGIKVAEAMAKAILAEA